MPPDSYESYLVRLWRRGHIPQQEVLFELVDTRTGERRFFAGTGALAAYLETGPDGEADAAAGTGGSREPERGTSQEL